MKKLVTAIRISVIITALTSALLHMPMQAFAEGSELRAGADIDVSKIVEQGLNCIENLLDKQAIDNGFTCVSLPESYPAYIQQEDTTVHQTYSGSSAEVASLRINKRVVAIGQTTDGRWTQIFYGSGMGYVRSELLAESPTYGFASISTDQSIIEYTARLLEDNIQPGVWEQFCSDDWKLILTSEDVEATYFPNPTGRTDTVYGMTDYSTKTIIVSSRSQNRVDQALFHEIGHYIYHKLSADDSAALGRLYEEYLSEGDEFGYGSHCTSSANEFFAESYKKYTLGKSLPAEVESFIENILTAMF